jgi:hypothetical protein
MQIPKTVAIALFAVPWLAAAALFGWILLKRVPPSGIFRATTLLDGKSAFINPFLPSERVTVPGPQPDGWTGQRITGDPTYFTTRVPGPYETAEITLEFRPIHQPLLEFGLVKDAAGNDLDLTPMYSSELQSEGWTQVDGGFVRNGTSASILQGNDSGKLATWDATSMIPALQDPAGPPVETKTSLRGNHDFYFVPAGGEIDVTFGLQDVNRTRGNTIVSFRVFRGDEELKRDALETNSSRETAMGKVEEHRIHLTDLAPGAYRVSIGTDDDVFIRYVRTTSSHWVVGPRLVFGDVVGYATTTFPGVAWTNSRHVVAETFHMEGLQTVSLGAATVKVARTHETFRLDRTDDVTGPVVLNAPKGDMRLVGDGWFALRKDAFFEPKPKRMTDGMQLDAEGIDGVITDYRRPQVLGDGWERPGHRFAARRRGYPKHFRRVSASGAVLRRLVGRPATGSGQCMAQALICRSSIS